MLQSYFRFIISVVQIITFKHEVGYTEHEHFFFHVRLLPEIIISHSLAFFFKFTVENYWERMVGYKFLPQQSLWNFSDNCRVQ